MTDLRQLQAIRVEVDSARGPSFADIARRTGYVGGLPVGTGDTDQQVLDKQTASASTQANNAALSAATAQGFVGGVLYPDTGTGLAAVAANAYFTVVGDGLNSYAILYRKVNGAAVEQARYASKTAAISRTLAALKAANISDGVSFFNGAQWVWKPGDYTSLIAGDPTSGMYVKSDLVPASAGAWVRQVDGSVNIRNFGAVGNPLVDDTAAFNAAANTGALIGWPVYIPSGNFFISNEVIYKEGVFGDGTTSVVTVMKSNRASWTTGGSSYDGRKAAFVISPAGPIPRTVPVHSFKLVGAADRPETRSGNPSTINFGGIGVLYTGNAFQIHAYDLDISFFYRGLDHDGGNGHFGGTGLKLSNCWYGMFFQYNTGDYRYINCDLTGNMFASIGCLGKNGRNGADRGGIEGLMLLGCHLGFSPYGIYQEDGDSTFGLLRLDFQQTGFEQIGNCCIRLGGRTAGQRRVSQNWFLLQCGCTYIADGTGEAMYFRINGDPTNHPQNVYAVNDIDLLQGDAIICIGDGLLPGSSGYVYNITDTLGAVQDHRGGWVFKILNNYGMNRGTGRVWTATQSIPANTPAVTGGDADLCSFNLSQTVDGLSEGEVGLYLNVGNTGAATRLQVRRVYNGVENVDPWRFIDIPAGASTISFRGNTGFGTRNRTTGVFTFGLRLKSVPAGITFNNSGLGTDASLRINTNATIN